MAIKQKELIDKISKTSNIKCICIVLNVQGLQCQNETQN